jgi:hypothetical protein
MSFHETLEEIEAECFGVTGLPNGELYRMVAPDGGFHIDRGTSKRPPTGRESPKRRAYKLKWDAIKRRAVIREALLRGEWPKVLSTPTRWLSVAAELGIDLVAVADQKYAKHWKKGPKP